MRFHASAVLSRTHRPNHRASSGVTTISRHQWGSEILLVLFLSVRRGLGDGCHLTASITDYGPIVVHATTFLTRPLTTINCPTQQLDDDSGESADRRRCLKICWSSTQNENANGHLPFPSFFLPFPLSIPSFFPHFSPPAQIIDDFLKQAKSRVMSLFTNT